MAALAVVPPRPKTLYDLESDLQAYLETADLVTPEQEPEFLEAFGRALTAAADKRDRVSQYLAHTESQIELAKKEIERLEARKADLEANHDRVEQYVVRVIEQLGPDGKGKYPKLQGATSSLGIAACPPSVEILDEQGVDDQYKNVTLKLPFPEFDRLVDALDPEFGAEILSRAKDIAIDKTRLKAALQKGAQIAGADLIVNKHRLVRK